MVSMEAWPTSSSLRSMEQGRLRTRVHPEAIIRPRSAHAQVYGLGAKRAAVHGNAITDDSGSEEERLQWYMQWISMEPAGGVMNRLWCGRSSDSDGWSLHIARPEQHAGPRHSTAPIGVWRETPAGRDWTGSTAETQGGPGRAGPRSKMYRWMGGHATACQQTTVTELFRHGSYSPIKGLSRIKRVTISG